MKPFLALLLVLLGGCAWSNPRNRPVWNAFEKHVVPDNDVAFYGTLPLTVPAGLGAILVDTLVVHPLVVVGDAADDAADEWRDLEWRKEYYTELGFLPLRAAWTPVKFALMWIARSSFDIDPRASNDPAARKAAAKKAADERKAAWLAFFAALERQQADMDRPNQAPETWDAELDAAFERAHREANAHGRLVLLRAAQARQLAPLVKDPWLGLRDPDPVVRYTILEAWDGPELPDDVRRALLADESAMVRELAAGTRD